jgi:hypothetical protein
MSADSEVVLNRVIPDTWQPFATLSVTDTTMVSKGFT